MTLVEPLPASACAGGRSLSEPRLSPDGATVAFVVRDVDGGRVVVAPAHGSGAERVVAADPEPAGRGGVLAWLGRDRLAYVTKEGDIAVAGAGLVAAAVEGGASSLAASPDGRRLAFVADTRSVCVVPSAGGPVDVVSAAADFALDPAWSPDGTLLAWQEWDAPNMPWDGSRIAIGPGAEIAGGADVAVQEPRWAPDRSAVAFLSDASGWLNLWVAEPDGAGARPVVAEEHEHGGPIWGGGSRSFAWSPDSTAIAFTRNEGGFGRLCTVRVATGEVQELSMGVHTSVTWEGGTLACLRTGARTPSGVVTFDPESGRRTLVAGGANAHLEAAAAWMPEPEPVNWRNDEGQTVHGRLWRPPAPAGALPPPLLVWTHGGPTDQRQVTFDARLAFFLSRGWAVLHPDPRGSTGWGRAWAQALRHGWGDADVDDVTAGARTAVDRGWADPTRLVAMGTSAGGMTSLLVAARNPDLWAAAIALYPVVDLLGLVAATHRYEAHYTDHLVGPLPEAADLYRARSPLTVAGRIRCPVLLLHGSADVVVPPEQSARLAAALDSNGTPVEHHVYEGEGHGWKSPETTRDELERTDDFLHRWVLSPASAT